MYTNFKMVFIYHNKRFFSNKFFLLTFLLISNCVFCQSSSERIDIPRLLSTELIRHLDPPIVTNDTTEIIVFRVKPEEKPDSSLRIIETRGQSYLEVRYLDKNIWCELYRSIKEHKYPPLFLRVHLLSVSISNAFKNKMLLSFSKAIALNEDNIELDSNEIFDGSNYGLYVKSNGKTISTSIRGDIKPHDSKHIVEYNFTYLVKMTNERIICDVINGSFNESKYEIYK